MKILILIGGIVFVLIFGAANYYIGLREWQAIGMLPFINNKIYWIALWIIAFSYIASMLGSRFLPRFIGGTLEWIGSYWIAAMLYFMLSLVLFDIVFLIVRWMGIITSGGRGAETYRVVTGALGILIVIIALSYGTWNARNPRVKKYEFTIDKQAGNLKDLHVVMTSDIHLGNIITNSRLEKMVNLINSLNPDVVLLGGDIVDEDPVPFKRQNMKDTFLKLKSKYGTYGVLGNHEYIGRKTDEIVEDLKSSGITLLRDEYVKIGEGFYLAGRDDYSKERFDGAGRENIEELMQGVDKSLPIILLDHQPVDIPAVSNNGVDIQLSGHTHGGGQIFPDEFFSGRLYEVYKGYAERGSTHIIVTSGFGTWGPPIRIGNHAEVIDLTLHFK